ncbi:MAG: tail fiber protein [Candidatus Sulfotelmatobacter sp.]|jgi:microcystin-dependent protein
MGSPYIGELRLFGGNFAPLNWALCNGQLLSISENPALYQLLGTTYGGDGVTTFGLPNLQGRFPVHQGQGSGLQNYILGQTAGSETVTLVANQLPVHNHVAVGSNGSATSPANATWGSSTAAENSFGPGTSANAIMNPASIGPSGSNQSHDNMTPFLAITFIICLQGIYPTQ